MKTSKLSGVALDWAVAKCEGVSVGNAKQEHGFIETAWDKVTKWEHACEIYNPSTDWSQGGPIIEREINVLEKRDGYWYAWRAKRKDGCVTTNFKTIPNSKEAWEHGQTPLIAAMRCFCVSRLGEEVEVPDEIANT